MTERDAIHALAWHFDYHANTCIPNVFFAGGEMDLAVVTRSGYLIECEVKLSLADWQADRLKDKWAMVNERAKVSRFYYAVPTELLDKRPVWVPAEAGLIELRWAPLQKRCWATEHVKAVRGRAPKLPDQQINALLSSAYYRFWRHELKVVA